MDKARGNEPKGCNMEELQAPGLSHFKGGKSQFFYHNIINIQDHGVVALVNTNPMSRRTPNLEFV